MVSSIFIKPLLQSVQNILTNWHPLPISNLLTIERESLTVEYWPQDVAIRREQTFWLEKSLLYSN